MLHLKTGNNIVASSLVILLDKFRKTMVQDSCKYLLATRLVMHVLIETLIASMSRVSF